MIQTVFDAEFLKRADSAAVYKYLTVLAKAYTPEWSMEHENPDLGVVLARLFSRMLAGNITRVKRLPEKISAQLVNMLDIRPMPAQPARSVVRFTAVGADSVYVPQGTKLSAKSEDGRLLTFETVYGLTVVTAGIGRLMFSSGEKGKIHYADDSTAITLYGGEQGTSPEAALTIGHPHVLRLEKNGSLQIKFEGMPPEKLEALADPKRFCWSLTDEIGTRLNAGAEKLAHQNCLRLTASEPDTIPCGRLSVECRAVKPVTEEISATAIYINSKAGDVEPEQIWQDDALQEEEHIYPFGKKLSLLSELRVACDSVLTQKGADITMSFRLEYENIKADLPEEPKKQYKLIMKAELPVSPPLTVLAQEVLLECWNGTGWRPIRTNPPIKGLFAGETAGDIKLKFTCPEDIEPLLLGAAERNWIRLRLLRAEGCYLPNTVHVAPMVSNIRFSYEYAKKPQRPGQAYVLRETRDSDITQRLWENKRTQIFTPLSLDGDRLMFGFDSKPIGDAINIYFDIEKASEPFWLEASYSGAAGFRKLHLDDYTDGFSRSEAIVFTAPRDFTAAEIYGESLYWIILRLRSRGESPASELKIRGVYLNAVTVEGKHTGDAEIFYTDELIDKNELSLSASDLLCAEVWVDEAASLSELERVKLREENPGGVRAEQDFSGALLHFWVRWNEVRDFGKCTAEDRCYILDRSAGTVRFSNGVHGRRPPAEQSCAIEVVPVSSAGSGGNVPKHSITQPLEQLDFIGGVDNILSACGGYDAQAPEMLLKYACAHIRSGGRVVTAEDLLDAVRFSCGEIAKLKLICGCEPVLLLFLPYDYENASQLFSQTEKHIRAVLSKNWQDSPQSIDIRLPDFAEIIVEASVISSGDPLNEEEAVRRGLDAFLNPITGGFGRAGWEIGAVPQREQILSVIQSVCPKARVEMLRISVRSRESGQYFDMRDKRMTQGVAAIHGRYEMIWRRKAESWHDKENQSRRAE